MHGLSESNSKPIVNSGATIPPSFGWGGADGFSHTQPPRSLKLCTSGGARHIYAHPFGRVLANICAPSPGGVGVHKSRGAFMQPPPVWGRPRVPSSGGGPVSPRPGAAPCPPVPRGPRTPDGHPAFFSIKNVFCLKLDAKSIPETLATTFRILLMFSIVLAHPWVSRGIGPPHPSGTPHRHPWAPL